MDFRIFRAINHLAARTGWAHPIFIADATYGVGLFAILLVVGYALARRDASPARAVAAVAWSGVAAVISLGANQLIGHLVDRPRPYVTHPTVHVLVARSRDFSFPSDHTVVAAAVAAGLWFVCMRLGAVSAVLALAMAFSRVYVGVHYPGDVLGGLAVGTAIAVAGHAPATRVLTPVVERIGRVAPRLMASAPR